MRADPRNRRRKRKAALRPLPSLAWDSGETMALPRIGPVLFLLLGLAAWNRNRRRFFQRRQAVSEQHIGLGNEWISRADPCCEFRCPDQVYFLGNEVPRPL